MEQEAGFYIRKGGRGISVPKMSCYLLLLKKLGQS